jgi:hypothetical protein
MNEAFVAAKSGVSVISRAPGSAVAFGSIQEGFSNITILIRPAGASDFTRNFQSTATPSAPENDSMLKSLPFPSTKENSTFGQDVRKVLILLIICPRPAPSTRHQR